MRLDLAERLRCPRPHVPTPLVVVVIEAVDRELRRGVLGCPVCQLEARVRDGSVWFEGPDAVASTGVPSPDGADGGPSDGTDALDRLRALLGLAEPGGEVLLAGGYAVHAAALARAADTAIVVMCAPPAALAAIPAATAVTVVRGVADRPPFADATFRAVALDAGLDADFAADAVRTVLIGGRVLGPVGLALPPGVRELARDAREWVAERVADAPVVPLARAGRAGAG